MSSTMWLFGLLLSIWALLQQGETQKVNKPPEFLPGGNMIGFSIREDTPMGTSVYRLRGYDPEETDVSYSVSGDYLSVNSATGEVTLVKPLDREEKSTVDVIITVTDGRVFGVGPNIIPVQLSIPIMDVNDNKPLFVGSPYSFTVLEGAPKGATLFSDIIIKDLDIGENARITLTCIHEQSPLACEMFDIRVAPVNEGEYVGIISLKNALDYEKTDKYILSLKAEDGGKSITQSSTTTVTIEVKDIQDQPPIFLNAPYSATVRESSPMGTGVLEIHVRDGDLGKPRELSLSLEGDDSGYFILQNLHLDSEGTLLATLATSDVPLDREDPVIINNGGIYTFTIRATEKGHGGESMTAQVTIVVTDIDDLEPTFSAEEVFVSVAENMADGTPLPGLDLIVSDGDVGDNAQFSLSLVDIFGSKGVFSVFPETAVGRTPVIIKIADSSRLDFEDPVASNFLFKVVASQSGVVVSSAVINVTVTDANDNSPTFSQPSYTYTVSELSTPGTVIATLTAHDLDSGTFGDIMYSLKGFGAEKFLASRKTGEITVGDCGLTVSCLDYERQTSFSLTYSAIDGGGTITSVNVFIDVIDENDNSPQFLQREYRRTVDEGAHKFDPPLFIKATDADGLQQGEDQVFYSIVDGNTKDEAFFMEPISGELSIQRPLTHMDIPAAFYTIIIRATDSGNPPRDADVRVYVTVGRDTNRPPRFTQWTYDASVSEDSASGTSVIKVSASDPDGNNSDIEYQVVSGARDSFIIDPTSGYISISGGALLDRDVMDTFKLIVVAIDGGKETQQSSTATVVVSLNDVNDKAPQFQQDSYVRYVSERLPIGEPVLTVTAKDTDLTSELRYKIISPVIARDKTGVTLTPDSPYDFRKVFTINDTTGEITVSNRLDHNEAAVIILPIQAKDINASEPNDQQIATSEVNFYIQAFSDKNPIFDPPWTPKRPLLEVEMNEEQETNSPLFSVAAKDPVTNQPVRRYEKVEGSDPQNVFNIAPITGKVSLNSRLDFESSATKTATFEVLAVAGHRSSQASVMVKIIDINDNSPKFTENEYHGRLAEDTVWPKTVMTVSATDLDTKEFGKVNYYIGGEGAPQFVINDTTGEIRVARGARLDRETTPTVTLEVTAVDTPGGGVTQRKTTVIVKLELTDVNDEAPIWDDGGHYKTVVAENKPIGSSVIHLIATDPDLGVNGLVRYQLPEPQGEVDGLFSIDPESGVLTVKTALSGKGRTEPYEVKLRAIDQGRPQQFSEAVVTLFIGDVSTNDGVPTFISPAPNQGSSIIENSKVGTAVFQVRALDPDDPNSPNGKIVYSFLDGGGENGAFTIDPNSGVITSRQELDRESRDQYTVVVVAQDLGRPPQLTSRLIVINVTDADDNQPVFIKNPGEEIMELSVEEEAAIGTIVGYVSATDSDLGNNALINYAILAGNTVLFGVNRTQDNRGMIYVRNRIDREQIDSVELTIICGKLGDILPLKRIPNPSDLSQLKVKILVQDLDDNRPYFIESSKTAGVTVDAPLQTEVLQVKAQDKDPTSLPIKYSLHNITFGLVEDTVEVLSSDSLNASEVFILHKNSGILRTNSPLSRFAHGIFTAYIAASSNPQEKPVFTKLTIYVLRDTDLLRFVFESTPGEVRHKLDTFSKEIEKVLSVTAELNIYDTAYYTDMQGAIDFSSTGSCFQLVGRSMQDSEVLLDSTQNHKLKEIFNEYKMKKVERCVPRRESRASADWVEVWVLILSAIIGIGALTAAISICCLYSRYKRRLHKTQRHLRLLDSPQPPGIMGGPPGPPGSIIMLPPGPPNGPPGGHPMMGMPILGPPHHGPPPAQNLSGPPPIGSGNRNYEWQERGLPLDNISYRSGPQM